MLRNDITDGLLVWLPTGADDKKDSVLCLDGTNRDGFTISWVHLKGNLTLVSTHLTFQAALMNYAEMIQTL